MPSWPNLVPPSNGLTVCNAEHWYQKTGLAPLLTSAAWTTANMAVYTPIWLPRTCRITHIAAIHGAAAAGNLDVGVYSSDSEGKPATRLTSLGSTAMSGTDILTLHNVADAWASGLVYLAMALNGVVGQMFRLVALTNNGSGPIEGSIFTEAAAFPLPATATPDAGFVAFNVPLLTAVLNSEPF